MNASESSVRKLDLGTVLLLGAIAAGAFLRLYNIGKFGFWTDELFHVFAAKSYLTDGSFHVPWVNYEYTRALPVTLITALSFRLFGESEASARVFFALTNVLFIVVGYRILKALLSQNIALIFAIATSFSVFSIQMSQECRMYTLFQLFYFLMSIAFFQGFEYNSSEIFHPGPEVLRNFQKRSGISFTFLIASLGLALLAASVQKLTYNFVFVVLAYCITMFIYQGLHLGFRQALFSKYAAVPILLAAVVLVLWLVEKDTVGSMARIAIEIPPWNRSAQSQLSFYHRVLIDSHPVLLAIYPFGAFLTILRYGRKGLFFVLSFIVLFLMHCFVFGRGSERYIFYILPFFISVGAAGVDFLVSSTMDIASNYASSLPKWQKKFFIAAAFASLSLVGYHWIGQTIDDAAVAKFPSWKGLDPALIREVRQGTSLTTNRWGFNYYFKKDPDFVVEVAYNDHDNRVISDLDEFKKVAARYPNLYLVTDKLDIYNDAFVNLEIRDYVLREMERIDGHKDDSRAMVFKRK